MAKNTPVTQPLANLLAEIEEKTKVLEQFDVRTKAAKQEFDRVTEELKQLHRRQLELSLELESTQALAQAQATVINNLYSKLNSEAGALRSHLSMANPSPF